MRNKITFYYQNMNFYFTNSTHSRKELTSFYEHILKKGKVAEVGVNPNGSMLVDMSKVLYINIEEVQDSE